MVNFEGIILETKITSPGKVYIPKSIRKLFQLEIGDYVKFFINKDDKSILIKTAGKE